MAKDTPVSPFIVGPWYDHVFFIWAPTLFLLVGLSIHWLDIADLPWVVGGRHVLLFPTLALAFTLAHLFAVFFRSHLNTAIFRQFPLRFTLVPVLALLGMNLSEVVFIFGAVAIVWFDVYHSSMQTFGFGRLYDMRLGNDPLLGRRLDQGMALFTYAGPIIAGVALARHLERLSWLERIGFNEATTWQIFALKNQPIVATVLVTLGSLYTAFYIYWYWRQSKLGYRVSRHKILLYVSLTTTSIWTWGFDSFGQAFLIMESFHAFQYFGIVWWSERQNLEKVFRLDKSPLARPLTMLLFLAPCFAFGIWGAVYSVGKFSTTLVILVEGLHYWFDGFIWSVRKKQV